MIEYKVSSAVVPVLKIYGDEILVCQRSDKDLVLRLIARLDVADLRRVWHNSVLPVLENSYGGRLVCRHTTVEYAKGVLSKLQQFMALTATTQDAELLAA